MTETSEEDLKLVTLARGAMARAGAGHGAAVRDLDGRTYAGAPVALASLALTGLQVAVATALSSGARGSRWRSWWAVRASRTPVSPPCTRCRRRHRSCCSTHEERP